MQHFDEEYFRVIRKILSDGERKEDRTGTGTISIFGEQMRFNLEDTFPFLTTKKVNTKAVINELIWMVTKGSTDVTWLQDRGHTFWDEWAFEGGSIGPGYGKQFRDCKGYDQVQQVISDIRSNPYSRRHIISLWQPDEISQMALPPCHGLIIQFNVSQGGELSCQMYQRSGDMFLGVPWNIAFYSLLTKVIAQITGLKAKEFVHVLGDAHVYLNHLDQIDEQLSREAKSYPTVDIHAGLNNIDDFEFDDVLILGYDPHPMIAAPVSI